MSLTAAYVVSVGTTVHLECLACGLRWVEIRTVHYEFVHYKRNRKDMVPRKPRRQKAA